MRESRLTKLTIFFVFLFIIVLISSILLKINYEMHYKYKGFRGEKIVKIKRGMNVKKIAELLEKERVIKSKNIFVIAYKLKFKDKKLNAGEFLFKEPLSTIEVLTILTTTYGVLKKITIKEGYDIFDIQKLFEKEGVCDKRSFYFQMKSLLYLVSDIDPSAKTLEGYLFPETYRFTSGFSCKDLLKTMVFTFKKVFYSLWKNRDKDFPYSKREVVIMASLIEKETSRDDERKLIASVFYNRLRRGMLLQCDPTIIYALKLEGKWSGRIRTRDIHFKHPYNTYTRKGFPPGPICNPSKKSIESALFPEKTDYLYFVSKNDGSHYFSKTYREHKKAVYIYQIRKK